MTRASSHVHGGSGNRRRCSGIGERNLGAVYLSTYTSTASQGNQGGTEYIKNRKKGRLCNQKYIQPGNCNQVMQINKWNSPPGAVR